MRCNLPWLLNDQTCEGRVYTPKTRAAALRSQPLIDLYEVTAVKEKERKMPLKDTQGLPELYIMSPDGTQVRFGKIQQTVLFDDCEYDIYGDSTDIKPMRTATFEVHWNPSTEMIFLLIHGRFPTNNWRRMHGLPVKRKNHEKRRCK